MDNVTTTFEPTSSVNCDVDQRHFPHFFLLPAGIIVAILAFLRRRTSFRKDVWGGRPGVVVPIDFLDMDHDRLAVICVFGAAAGTIAALVDLNSSGFQDRGAWERAFLFIGTCVEIAFIYYPHFGCLASHHKIIGALMGFLYAAVFFVVVMTANFQKCNGFTTFEYAVLTLSVLPQILCHLFIVGKFLFVLYKEIKEYGRHNVRLIFQDEPSEVKLTTPWLIDYVKELINSKQALQYSGMQFYMRKIYNPKKNFKFSTQTLSMVMICFIILCNMTINLISHISKSLENANKMNGRFVKLERVLYGSLIGATILTAIFCIISLTRFMESHKNNMLKMFKGDKSFIPRTINMQSKFMVGKGLRFHSFQIGFFLWGYLLVLVLFCILLMFFYALSVPYFFDRVANWLKTGGVLMTVAIVTYVSMLIVSATVFRDENFPRNVVSIDNRNVYLVFSYFWFFVGLPMGFFSAILRLLKTMVVGALMLPRIDHSIMPDGFQWFDRGFDSYICYLHVQTAYRNPVLRVFCQILNDETRKRTELKWTCSAQARARWFLALTLARNPHLVYERKPDILAYKPIQIGYVQHGDVKIEVGPYEVFTR